MQEHLSILLNRLWVHISKRRRWQLLFIFILILFTSFAEIISVGSILPFLGVLIKPEGLFTSPYMLPFIKIFNIDSAQQLLFPFTLIFIMAAIIVSAMRLFLLWISTRISYSIGADFSFNIYQNVLYQPYIVHCYRNSSEVVSGITNKTSSTILIVNSIINLISSIILCAAIFLVIFLVDSMVAFTAFSGILATYFLIITTVKNKLLIDSRNIANNSTKIIKSLQEGLGAIRDILLGGFQSTYSQIYRNTDIDLRQAQSRVQFIKQAPRYLTEGLAIVLIATVAYIFVKNSGALTESLPVIGILTLSAQKLLPILQQIYNSWATIQSEKKSLQDTLALLDQEIPSHLNTTKKKLNFFRDITLSKVSFYYDSPKNIVLKNINLTIKKGDRIGLIGKTGSGKSTLIDIIMGLLEPQSGFLKIDGQIIKSENHSLWRNHIAQVSQHIFLNDNSIAQNIAFGIPVDKINFAKVKKSAIQAQIDQDIKSWPSGYQTIVGERGVRLSGGQRQRIGIARALYRNAEVIILDEATSALDNDTEAAVMKSIEALHKNLTIIIIAHRVSTLKNCNKIIELTQGKIKRICTYKEILKLRK
jgi:ABC-type multidrug transport system fused ATPase/permease subunit